MSERTWAIVMFWLGVAIGILLWVTLIFVTNNWQDEVDPPGH